MPSTKGGTEHVPLSCYPNPYHRGLRFDAFDRGRVCGPGATLCGRVLGLHGRMDPAWTAPAVATLYDRYKLSPTDTGRSSPVHAGLPQAPYHAPAPWTRVRPAPVPSAAMDACLTPRVASRLADLGGGAVSPCRSLAPTPWGGGSAAARGVGTVGSRPRRPACSGPPVCHDGTARPLPRPPDATAQQPC